MKIALLLAVLVSAGCAPCEPKFPNVDELDLLYFSWVRSFDDHVQVTITKEADRYLLRSVVSKGPGIGGDVIKVSESDIAEREFRTLATMLLSGSTLSDTTQPMAGGADGSVWRVGGRAGSFEFSGSVWSPLERKERDQNRVAVFGLEMIRLSGIPVDASKIY
jgi:hypothetical protein